MLKIWDADNFRRTLAGVSCCFAAPAALMVGVLVHPGARMPAGSSRRSPPNPAGSRPPRC